MSTQQLDDLAYGPDGRWHDDDMAPSDEPTVPAPNRAQRRSWPKRRQWLDRIAADNRFTSGAKAWLLLLARRSDDGGKPVWGNQVKMAEQIGRDERSVRRYRLEAEALGYVVTYRAKPERSRVTGRWCRRKANAYYLRIPAAVTDGQEAPRRRQRAPYCVVGSRRSAGSMAVSHLPDNHDRSSPLRGAPTGAAPASSEFFKPVEPYEPPTDEQRAIAEAVIAKARAKLRSVR